MLTNPPTPAPSHSTPLRDFLATTDAPCPNCGYNLKGLATNTCPECNEGIRLWVTLEHPLPRVWLACVLSLAGVGGFFLLIGLIFIVAAIAEGVPPAGFKRVMMFVLPWTFGLTFAGACAALLRQRGRRWFRARIDAHRRRALVTAFIIIPAAAWLAWVALTFAM
jgi:hypothetical protein